MPSSVLIAAIFQCWTLKWVYSNRIDTLHAFLICLWIVISFSPRFLLNSLQHNALLCFGSSLVFIQTFSFLLSSSNRNFIIIRQVKCEKCYEECNCKLIEARFIIAMLSIVWAGSGEVCSIFNVKQCTLYVVSSFISSCSSSSVSSHTSDDLFRKYIKVDWLQSSHFKQLLQSLNRCSFFYNHIKYNRVSGSVGFIVSTFWIFFLMSNNNRILKENELVVVIQFPFDPFTNQKPICLLFVRESDFVLCVHCSSWNH